MLRPCQSRPFGDQVLCGPCGLAWDAGDPEPPKCKHRSPGVAVRRIERHSPDPAPGFNAISLVHQIANRTLSKADFELCRAIADEAYALGRAARISG